MKKKLIAGLLSLGLVLPTATACEGVDFDKIVSDVTNALGIPNVISPKEVKLVDFEATKTEEAYDIGSLYELRRIVKDEDGNEYVLSYEVKDSTGKAVSVIANCFEVVDIGGYTITYTVTISENDVRTSVVTIPSCDGDGPTIAIGEVVAGAIGETYVLPEITFDDMSEIVAQSVKVYLVEGTEQTEVTLTETAGKYSFLPSEEGTYRLSVYAKDSAGNESTRTVDFVVEKILVGEVFNPSASSAQTQLYFSGNNNVFSGAEKVFVSAEENTDETYGGSYMRMVATNPTDWGNLKLTPRFEASAYANYDYVNVWVYVESTATTSVGVVFFNDTSLTQSVTPNQWTLVSLDATAFFGYVYDTNNFFSAIKYNSQTTGVRIGEILAVNNAEVTVTETQDVVLNGETAEVEFSVATNPTGVDCAVEVKNSAGETQEVVSLGNGNYKAMVSALGEYTVTVTATNGYYGVAKTGFSVLAPNRIVVEDVYAEGSALGQEITLYDAYVQRGDNATDETVTVKVYAKNGADWEDVSADIAEGKYTPSVAGMLKIEYSVDGLDSISYEIEIYDPTIIFDPASQNALSQVEFNWMFGNGGAIVSAEENDDTTYGGAYVWSEATRSDYWGGISKITPYLDVNLYSEYDSVAFWLYIDSPDDATVSVAIFGGAVENVIVTPKQWTQVIIPMETFMTYVGDSTKQFVSWNLPATTARGIRLGDVVAMKNAELTVSDIAEAVLENATVEVEFSVTANPTEAEYEVVVKNSLGEAQEVVSLGNGNYKAVISAVGDYTVTVTATNGYYGVAETEFTVIDFVRIVVEDVYAESGLIEEEIILHEAQVQRGDIATDDEVTVKVYWKNGAEWVDVSEDIVNGTYTPTIAGTMKVEYTAEGFTTVSYEIEIYDPMVVFNPESKNALSQVAYNAFFDNGVKEIISAEANNDTTYGGAYLRAVPTKVDGWGSLKTLTPQLDPSAYSEYESVAIWFYVESTSNEKVTVLFFQDTAFTQSITPNQWVQVIIPRATFMESTNQVIAINYKNTVARAICVGEIVVGNSAELAVSEVSDVILESESANVAFSVTATPTDAEYTVTVKNSAGETQEVVSLGNGNYQATVTALGNYTIQAVAKNGYFGQVEKSFTVVAPVKLVIEGAYSATSAIGKEITVYGAHVELSNVATDDVVTVKVYEQNGTEWVDITANVVDGKYTPNTLGKIKVEYTAEGFDPVSYEIEIFDPSVVFNPVAEKMYTQLSATGNVFGWSNDASRSVGVSEDETYSGAYVQINAKTLTNQNKSGNVYITPNNSMDSYAEYTTIKAWIYLEALGAADMKLYVWGAAYKDLIPTNQWVQIEIPVDDTFLSKSDIWLQTNFANGGTWGVTGIRIGEITAINA